MFSTPTTTPSATGTGRALLAVAIIGAAIVALGTLPELGDRAAFAEDPAQAQAGDREPASGESDADRIRELVRGLGDPGFEVRERATLRLLGEGERAIQFLEEGLQSRDAEVRARCSILIDEIKGLPAEERDGEGAAAGAEPPAADRKRALRDMDSLRESFDEMREAFERVHPRVHRWELRPDMRLHRGDAADAFAEVERMIKEFEREFEERGLGAGGEEWSRIEEMMESLEQGSGAGEAEGRTRAHAEFWRDGEKIFERNFEGTFAGQPHLGVWIESLHPALRSQLELAEDEGVLITGVIKETPAARAGLERYDIVLSFDGAAVGATRSLRDAVREAPAEKPIAIEILRGGRRQTLEVQLDEPKKAEAK